MRLIAPVRKSGSGSNAFLGLADDGRSYWLKVPGNAQGDEILSAEQIVAAAAMLIEAPAVKVELIEVPEALSGWEYATFHRLRPGIAHGSLVLDSAEEGDRLVYSRRDGNPDRMPSFFALWDWCMGDDEQWLFDQSKDYAMWTFDHGWWLGGGPGWDAESLATMVDRDWRWGGPVAGSNPEAFEAAAVRLEGVTPQQLIGAVASVPVEWGVSESELETVAWALYRRRGPVAQRLRELSARAAH